MEESRKDFEEAVKKKFGDLIDQRICKNGDGEYFSWDMQVAWWAWQASRQAVEIQLDSHTEFEIEHMIQPEEDGYAKGWIDGRNYGERQIRAAGLRIKGE